MYLGHWKLSRLKFRTNENTEKRRRQIWDMVEGFNIHSNVHVSPRRGERRGEKLVVKEVMTKDVPTMTRHQARDLRSATKSK